MLTAKTLKLVTHSNQLLETYKEMVAEHDRTKTGYEQQVALLVRISKVHEDYITAFITASEALHAEAGLQTEPVLPDEDDSTFWG